MRENNKNREKFKKIIKLKFCLILIIFSFIACKKNIEKIKVNNIHFSKIDINFPDTLFVNKSYNGFVIYKSLFDTLNLKNGKDRYINLYLKGCEKPTKFSDVKKIAHDTFVMYEDTIRFKISFKSVGKNYLSGHIEDEVDIEKNEKIRIINRISSFHKLVYVK